MFAMTLGAGKRKLKLKSYGNGWTRKERKKLNDNYGREWTDDEKRKLMEIMDSPLGETPRSRIEWEEIAKKMGRTKTAVKKKYYEIKPPSVRMPITGGISFNRVKGVCQVCSYCEEPIDHGEMGLTIREDCDYCSYNVWIHLRCVEDFIQSISSAWEENKGELIAKAVEHTL